MRKIVKWLTGQLKAEREWLQEPRRLPNIAKDYSANDPCWVVSQEFVHEHENRLSRYYLIAHPIAENLWKLHTCEYSLNDPDINMSSLSWGNHTADAVTIVSCIIRQEKHMDSIGARRLPQSPCNWNEFAAIQGLAFDKSGQVFVATERQAITREATLDRSALDIVFNLKAEAPIGGWDWLHAKISVPIVIDPAWTTPLGEASSVAEWLTIFRDRNAKLTPYLKAARGNVQAELKGHWGNAGSIGAFMMSPYAFRAAGLTRVMDASLLLTALHAAHNLYVSREDLDATDMAKLRSIGAFVVAFSQERFGLKEAEAQKVAELILGPADPQGEALPVDRVLAAMAASVSGAAKRLSPRVP